MCGISALVEGLRISRRSAGFKDELTTEGTGEHWVDPLCSDGGCTDVH
jgi:hypothetical protein